MPNSKAEEECTYSVPGRLGLTPAHRNDTCGVGPSCQKPVLTCSDGSSQRSKSDPTMTDAEGAWCLATLRLTQGNVFFRCCQLSRGNCKEINGSSAGWSEIG